MASPATGVLNAAVVNPRLQAILPEIPLFRGAASMHNIGDILKIWNSRTKSYVICQVVLQRHGNKVSKGLMFMSKDTDFEPMLRRQRALRMKNLAWPEATDPDFHAKVQRILLEEGIEPKPLGYVDPEACRRQPKKIQLDVHQKILAACLVYGPYPGVIAYHSLGSGKSCSAIHAMNEYLALRESLVSLDLVPDRPGPHVLFIIPPRDSLIENLKKELTRCPGFLRDQIEKKNLQGPALSMLVNKHITVMTYVSLANHLEKGLMRLDDKLILMDEAHNMLYPEPQYRKKYDTLYQALLQAKNSKLLLMTATPVFKNITDLPRLVNLCLGPRRPKLPDTDAGFRERYFQGTELRGNQLEIDLRGTISFFNQENDPSYFARKALMRPDILQTNEDHFTKWKESAQRELQAYKAPAPDAFDHLEQVPVFKEGMRRMYKGSSEADNYPYRSYKAKGIWTPKFQKLLENIETEPRKKHVIFSRHLEAGVRSIGAYLEKMGWVRMSNNKSDKVTSPPKQYNRLSEELEKAGLLTPGSDGNKLTEEEVQQRRTAIADRLIEKPYYGFILLNKDTVQHEIKRARSMFNAPENADGKWARVIVLDESFFEGVSLLQTNVVHLFEPLPNYQSERQAIARAIRRCSHATQPWPWEVKIFKYFHEFEGQPMTDQWMQRYNEYSRRVLEQVLQSAEQASFEYKFAHYEETLPETEKIAIQRRLSLLERVRAAFARSFRRGTPKVVDSAPARGRAEPSS